MRIEEIMTKGLRTIGLDVDADIAYRRMQQDRIHHFVVLEGKRIVGVISARDLGGDHGAPVRINKRVADLMVKNAVTVAPDDTVRHAANLMRGNGIDCLVVIADGKPVGVVTTTDLLDMIGRGMEQTPRDTERMTLHARGPKKAKAHRAALSAQKFGRH